MRPYPLLPAPIFPFLAPLAAFQTLLETLTTPHPKQGQRRRSTIPLVQQLGAPAPSLERCCQEPVLLVTYPLAGFSFVLRLRF